MIRMGYGPDQIYTQMAQRSLGLWHELFDQIGTTGITPRHFQPTGILWLAKESDPYCQATLSTLEQCGVRYEKLDRAELQTVITSLIWSQLVGESWSRIAAF